MPTISSSNASLNTTHISSNYANYEAARNSFFTLVVNNLSNLLNINYKEDPADADPDEDYLTQATAEQSLMLNVTKCPVPHFGVGVEEYRRGNDVVRFATVPTWEGGTIEVDDVVGLDTKSILTSWLYLAYNPHTRMGGRMADYKKSAVLCEYTQDYELIRKWKIEGIFVTKISEGEFDRENDGKRKLSVEFTFDRAVMELPKAANATTTTTTPTTET
jgi:hypothetical protein